MVVEASTPIGPGRAATAVTSAIRNAATATGTSFSYLLATAKIESDLDPRLTMKSSSLRRMGCAGRLQENSQ
jgi:hypothetical protein